jgi:hypothetical protein
VHARQEKARAKGSRAASIPSSQQPAPHSLNKPFPHPHPISTLSFSSHAPPSLPSLSSLFSLSSLPSLSPTAHLREALVQKRDLRWSYARLAAADSRLCRARLLILLLLPLLRPVSRMHPSIHSCNIKQVTSPLACHTTPGAACRLVRPVCFKGF